MSVCHPEFREPQRKQVTLYLKKLHFSALTNTWCFTLRIGFKQKFVVKYFCSYLISFLISSFLWWAFFCFFSLPLYYFFTCCFCAVPQLTDCMEEATKTVNSTCVNIVHNSTGKLQLQNVSVWHHATLVTDFLKM